jgi:hypothetical protein
MAGANYAIMPAGPNTSSQGMIHWSCSAIKRLNLYSKVLLSGSMQSQGADNNAPADAKVVLLLPSV